MEREFVTYEQALVLKELGYNEKCLGYYFFMNHERIGNYTELKITDDYVPLIGYGSERCKAPLKQQVFRWFREKYNMLACVYSNASGFLYEYHDTIGGTHRFDSGFTGDCEYSGAFTTYEKAENACIDKLVELAKQQEDGKTSS